MLALRAISTLLRAGRSRPCDLRTVASDSGAILLDNVYGWVEGTERGIYRRTALGEAALKRWPGIGDAAERHVYRHGSGRVRMMHHG